MTGNWTSRVVAFFTSKWTLKGASVPGAGKGRSTGRIEISLLRSASALRRPGSEAASPVHAPNAIDANTVSNLRIDPPLPYTNDQARRRQQRESARAPSKSYRGSALTPGPSPGEGWAGRERGAGWVRVNGASSHRLWRERGPRCRYARGPPGRSWARGGPKRLCEHTSPRKRCTAERKDRTHRPISSANSPFIPLKYSTRCTAAAANALSGPPGRALPSFVHPNGL
jgi:hypothetical protein